MLVNKTSCSLHCQSILLILHGYQCYWLVLPQSVSLAVGTGYLHVAKLGTRETTCTVLFFLLQPQELSPWVNPSLSLLFGEMFSPFFFSCGIFFVHSHFRAIGYACSVLLVSVLGYQDILGLVIMYHLMVPTILF